MMVPNIASVCSLLFILNSVTAQTPAGFQPKVDTSLDVSFGAVKVTPVGVKLPRSDLASMPTVNPPSGSSKGIIFMIDQDVPRNGTRTTLLHWMATEVDLTTTPAKIPTDNGAAYLQPNPPAGDSPHRYVFLLFAQPDGFSVPAQFANINPATTSTARVGFSLTEFAAQGGLGMPLAANYIQVQNADTVTTATTFPPIGSTDAAVANGTVLLTSGATPTPTPTPTSKSSGATPIAMAGGLLAGLVIALV